MLQTPTLDPWAVVWPILRAVLVVAVISITLALLKGALERKRRKE